MTNLRMPNSSVWQARLPTEGESTGTWRKGGTPLRRRQGYRSWSGWQRRTHTSKGSSTRSPHLAADRSSRTIGSRSDSAQTLIGRAVDDAMREILIREARITCTLKDPNVATIFEVDEW